MMQPSRTPSPAPPYSAGTCVFISPMSHAFFTISRGNSPVWSWWAAFGMISSLANFRASSWIWTCSSVNEKSIMSALRSIGFPTCQMLAALQEVPSSARTRSPFARDAGMDDPALLPGRSNFELAWKPTAHLYIADDRLVMESNTPKVDIEEPMTFADGRTIWLRINKVPLRDAGGAVFGLLGTYEDIPVQRQAAVDLHESEERFRATVEQAAVGIAHLGTAGVRRLACHVLESLG